MSDKEFPDFSRHSRAGQTLLHWWEGLESDRGDRALLRRCRSLTEVAFVPAYHRLLHDLSPHYAVNSEGLAIVAGLAAHVKPPRGPEEQSKLPEFAEQMAQPKAAGGSARVSGLRFRRLLRIGGREELFPALVRIVALLDGSVNLLSLAQSAYWWNERTRKNWALDYYSKAPSED